MKNVFPTAQLHDGVMIANHSSSHDFIFKNGVKLGGVSEEQCRRLSALQTTEIVTQNANFQIVRAAFSLTEELIHSFNEAIQLVGKNGLVIVSRIHRNAINEQLGIDAMPQIVCTFADRATKICDCDKFSH